MTCLPPDTLPEQASSRIDLLDQLIAEKQLALAHAPAGTLRTSNHKGVPQYYHRKDVHDNRGTYINHKNFHLAKALAQKKYDSLILKELEKERQVLSAFLTTYHPEDIEKVFLNSKEPRKLLIDPVFLPDEKYVEKWRAVEYMPNSYPFYNLDNVTDRGEIVRSKSELLIANALNKSKIPYRYEYPVAISNNKIVYPDFYCLNVRLRKEVVWEHFGRMQDDIYAERQVDKINQYMRAGYRMGENFICTFESAKHALTTRAIQNMINSYLK